MKRNKNLGENRKESQLPIKSRGCNKTQGFRGNCDSKGKLGMCPSLAEPDSGGFPRTSRRRNKKFFDPTIFQKCWRGVGEQPTFAKQIEFCNLFFLLQLHFLKLTNSLFNCLYETSCKFRQGNGAIAACWQAKAGVEPPFAECYRSVSLRAFLHCFM